MVRFLIVRTLTGLLVLWLISMTVFALFYVVPSNFARTLGGRQATPETIAAINERLGLDQPLWKQYASFVGDALHGDLGYDYYHQVPVTTIITQAVPVTLSLAVGAAVIWLVLGVSNGVVSATHPRSLADRALTAFALFFYSMPSFLLGLVLLYFLYFKLTQAGYAWFPPGGYVPLSAGVGGCLHPAHPRVDARRAQRGLHQDRPLQGHLRATRHLPARAAQRPHPHRDPVRHRPGPARRRRPVDRDRLQPPGPGADRHRRDHPAGPSRDHRDRPVRLDRGGGREHPRRPHL